MSSQWDFNFLIHFPFVNFEHTMCLLWMKIMHKGFSIFKHEAVHIVYIETLTRAEKTLAALIELCFILRLNPKNLWIRLCVTVLYPFLYSSIFARIFSFSRFPIIPTCTRRMRNCVMGKYPRVIQWQSTYSREN